MYFSKTQLLVTVALQLLFVPAHAIIINKGKKTSSESRASSPVSTSKPGRSHAFEIGMNSFARSLSKTSSVDSGKKDFFSPFQFPLLLGYSYQFSTQEKLAVQLDYTLFPKKGPDGGTEESHLILRVPYIRKWSDSNFAWKAGAGFHQFSIKGRSGSVILNNGASTATFYLPDRTSTTNQFLLEAGFCHIKNRYEVSTSFLIAGPLNNKTRTISLLFGLSYQIGSL